MFLLHKHNQGQVIIIYHILISLSHSDLLNFKWPGLSNLNTKHMVKLHVTLRRANMNEDF